MGLVLNGIYICMGMISLMVVIVMDQGWKVTGCVSLVVMVMMVMVLRMRVMGVSRV